MQTRLGAGRCCWNKFSVAIVSVGGEMQNSSKVAIGAVATKGGFVRKPTARYIRDFAHAANGG